MVKDSVLGVKVDFVTSNEATEKILAWFKDRQKRYIVTPNPEIIAEAQEDSELLRILNDADLSIPDSHRLDWAKKVITANTLVKKFVLFPLFLFPTFLAKRKPVIAGVDLLQHLCEVGNRQVLAIGLLGGREGVAIKAAERLRKQYPRLKISFADSGGLIDQSGNYMGSQKIHNTKYVILDTDILFVGLGHGKQEKWINKNLNKVPVKVFMAVGGAIDYISGEVPRAPVFIRKFGFEWFFRLLMQPWRIKRFNSLVKFILLVLASGKT